MNQRPKKIVVLGAGHAGVEFCSALRERGFSGPVCLVSGEPVYPYERPPLSKSYLAGETSLERHRLRSPTFYDERGIELLLGTKATRIERASGRVLLSNGRSVNYDVLVLALGAKPRQCLISGIASVDTHYLHDAAEAARLCGVMRSGARLLICGGGFIGLEVAATAAKRGLDVTLVEQKLRLLERVAPEPVSRFFHDVHRGHRVAISLGRTISEFRQGTRAVLSDQSEVEFDILLAGVGSSPNVDLALDAKLAASHDGIPVDRFMRTLDPNVYAIGDCAIQYDSPTEPGVRIESVGNALQQARIAAADICEVQDIAPEVPWFWSSQYDHQLQMAGTYIPSSACLVKISTPERMLALQHRSGRVEAVFGVNAAAEVQAGRRLIATGKSMPEDWLASSELPLRTLLKQVT
jgi:3-phenylpropionate/trans-cinnamate dioxygenase ferredoxin reductase component